MTQAQVIAALETIGTMSTTDICQITSLGRSGVQEQLRNLRAKKLVYIAHYERQPPGHPGGMVPVYALGNRPDTPKPKAKTRAQICRDHYARHTAIISARRYPNARQSAGVWAGLM